LAAASANEFSWGNTLSTEDGGTSNIEQPTTNIQFLETLNAELRTPNIEGIAKRKGLAGREFILIFS